MRSAAAIVVGLFASLAVVVPLPAADTPRAAPSAEVKPMTGTHINELNGKTLAEWVRLIKNPDPSLAETAIRMVSLFGPDAAAVASDALVGALQNRDASLRVNAALVFSMIGVDEKHAAKVVAALARCVNEDNQAIVRFHAAIALGRIGDGYRSSIPALAYRCTDQSSWEIRRAAAFALGRAGKAMGAQAGAGVEMHAAHALIQLCAGSFPDHCAQVRFTAVQALGSMGIPGAPNDKAVILMALKRALSDRYKPVVIWAHLGLMADGEPIPDHLPAILAFMKGREGKDFEAHLEAIRALGSMGTKAKSAVPQLTEELEGPEPALVVTACWALGEMKDEATPALPALQQLKAKKEALEEVRNQAGDAIERISGKTTRKP